MDGALNRSCLRFGTELVTYGVPCPAHSDYYTQIRVSNWKHGILRVRNPEHDGTHTFLNRAGGFPPIPPGERWAESGSLGLNARKVLLLPYLRAPSRYIPPICKWELFNCFGRLGARRLGMTAKSACETGCFVY